MAIKEKFKQIEQKVDEASFAMEMIKFTKDQTDKTNRRQFIIIILLILALIGSVSYTVYLLNNIGEETTITKSIDMDDIDTIEKSEINNN